MTTRRTIPPFPTIVLLVLIVFFVISAPAQTLWTGPTTNFTQTAGNSDVLVPGSVALSRNASQWLFNPYVDTLGAQPGTPSDTEWAFGSLANYASLNYQSFDSYRINFNLAAQILNNPMVVHLINEDIYLSITFTAWGQHGVGSFSYTRSTPAVVTPPKPTVSITNPPPSAVFAAPANVKISANASVSSGTVTNVSFFGNSSPLGSSQASPFSITANSLSAGSYGLTAVATAAGVSATSSVVNISVVTPVVTSLSGVRTANNQFSFSYSVNPGLSYVIQSSSNMVNWIPLTTNVPANNPAFFTNSISRPDSFYRVGRLPNP